MNTSPLLQAGFEHVVIIDAHADLNAYGNVDGQSVCCSPVLSSLTGLPIAGADLCGPANRSAVHEGLIQLLKQYNINDYAASVKVYAVKPQNV